MRAKYSIGVTLVLLATTAAAAVAPCPVGLDVMAKRVAALRHLAASFAPPCESLPQSAARAQLDAKLRRDLPIDPALYLEMLARIGLIDDAKPPLYDRLLDFYTAQVLGYYEPAGDTMVLFDSPAAAAAGADLVWAHELEHAVQQRRFGLPRKLVAMHDNGDAQRAASAIAEGDAMLVMLIVGGREANLEQAAKTLAAQATAVPTPAGLPRFFVEDLVFPYSSGLAYVLRAYRRGGWEAVDRLLRAPPASTAALLHPGRPPSGPAIDDGSLPPVPPGWTLVADDTLGEWGLRMLLKRHVAGARAADAAAAWDADRMRLIRRSADPDDWALAWRLRCRTAASCRQLESVLRAQLPTALQHLAGSGAPPRIVWRRQGATTIELLAGWPRLTLN